ncbi:hypothetical protein [Streptomyces sp. bgisy034]|uniref:hypothetical protein n=1 Tax=Streptomyces sp. bgisy034 TaxID=3413774 RepID=UPI003EB9DEDA
MTTTSRSPRLLLLSAVVLALTGVGLLCLPQGSPIPATPAPTATDQPTEALSTGKDPSGMAPSATPTGSPSASPSALPPHGDGPAGDRAVQQSLEAAWPADLPHADERTLLTAGRALLRADATGIGRAKWPTVFTSRDGGTAVAPAFATARFRIQAAIARQDGGPDKAVVHLVWAGQDRGGAFADLRITDLSFARIIKKGAVTWTPQPRT